MPTIKVTNQCSSASSQAYTRPLYVKAIPEEVWLRVHDNAHRSRMRLKDYVAAVLQSCEPISSANEGAEAAP